jgi:putative spermidine/putrescine transport system ATP-binding protein
LSNSYLQFKGLAKSYDGQSYAVDHIDLSIRRGEFATFLGPSGSGKTTTLMMLAGFETPSDGRIFLDGRDITTERSWKRNIGVVFQNYALFPHMTVGNNIAFPLRMRNIGRSEIEVKVRRVLEIVGLGTFEDRRPNQLSGGQQQRVALARGLVFEPTLLLLDEPLGALDKNLRELMQIELKRIHREVGVTMIYVTHDQSEAMTLSDQVIVFNNGRIEQAGPPLDLYDRPATRFVAQFIGDGNIFEVLEIDNSNGRVRVHQLGWVQVEQFNTLSAPSDKRWLILRPEEITPLQHLKTSELANRLCLITKAVIQYGNDCLVVGSLPDQSVEIRMRLPNRFGRDVELNSQIEVGWSAQNGFVV